MNQELTKGKIRTHFLRYLSASFGSALIACIYGLVDAAVVGQYAGPKGTAALSVVMPIWTILYSVGLLVGIGGSVSYSFYKSSGKADKANAYFTLSFVWTSIIAALCWITLIVFDDGLLRLFGADDELLLIAKEYLKPIKFVIPVYPFQELFASFLRNDNAPGRATFGTLFGGGFNIFGDLFFVFVLKLGVFGAGLATSIGGSLSVLIMLTHFLGKKNTLRFTRVHGLLHKTKNILLNGLSACIFDLAMGVIAILFNNQVMRYLGADALAVFGVIVQITGIVQCSSYSIGQAAQPIVSANLGGGEEARIRETKKYALIATAVFGVVWAVSVLAIPTGYVYLFMSPTPEVLKIAPHFMRIYAVSYFLLPLNVFSAYYFQAVMKPHRAYIISLGRGVLLSGILVYLLPAVFGAELLWWVMPVTEALIAGYSLFMLFKKERLIKQKEEPAMETAPPSEENTTK